MRYLYYPGCSLKGTGRAYEKSLLAVFKALNVDVHELDDWNCCGSTAYMSVDEEKSFALAGRNLALAELSLDGQETIDMIAPCSACYLVLNKAQHYIEDYPEMGGRVIGALDAVGLKYKGKVRVRHPLDVLINDIGLDAIKAKITKPLTDLKVAPYYGCQIVRPYSTFDDQHDPTTMDRLLEITGATVVDYPLKTKCCGGSLTGTMPEVAISLVHSLVKEAERREADMIATVCPLCQFNLDGYQDRVSSKYGPVKMPVVYFTQVLGLAMGIPGRDLDIQRGIVPAEPALAKRGVVYA